jgi:hypothetical protein
MPVADSRVESRLVGGDGEMSGRAVVAAVLVGVVSLVLPLSADPPRLRYIECDRWNIRAEDTLVGYHSHR